MDTFLIDAQLTLGALGVLGVATATSEAAFSHLGRVALAFVITALVSRVSPQRVVKLSAPFFLGVLALLVLVLFGKHGLQPVHYQPLIQSDLNEFRLTL